MYHQSPLSYLEFFCSHPYHLCNCSSQNDCSDQSLVCRVGVMGPSQQLTVMLHLDSAVNL